MKTALRTAPAALPAPIPAIPRPRRPLLAALLAAGLAAALPAHAQPDTQPGLPSPVAPSTTPNVPTPVPAPSTDSGSDAARDALKKQSGDVDQSQLLKDTLTKTDRQYSLLKAGRVAVNYDLTYQYIGTESINVGLDSTGSDLTLFDIENTRSHTITNAVSIDYGLLDNVTVNFTLPLVSKFSQSESYSGVSNDVGDLSLGARFQPFVQTPSGPTFTFTSSLSLPTGRSPFKTVEGSALSTGAGYGTATIGMNASQVLDPVALFASVNFTDAMDARNLHQTRGSTSDPTILTAVHPGKSVGWGAGFTYALSYNISTSVAFQQTVTLPSTIYYLDSSNDAQVSRTAQQVAAILNFGLGVRISPKTTINLTAGIGLTTDSPDFTLGLTVPLSFASI